MERVIILADSHRFDGGKTLPVDHSIINQLLDEGWTVKHVKATATEHNRTIIFVLEKKD